MDAGPTIAPVDLVPGSTIEAWADPEVRAWFLDAYRHGVPPVTSLAMEAHQPVVLRAAARWWWAVFHQGVLDPVRKERLRVDIADLAGCAYCATSALPMPSEPRLDHAVQGGVDDHPAWTAADRFARALAVAPWTLGPGDIDRLGAAFAPDALTELVAFCAWQVGGPRALRSWGADRWKHDGRVDLDTLPVTMAYRAEAAAGASPTVDRRPVDPAAVRAVVDVTEDADSPPRPWLRVLAPRPDLLLAWTGLYDATVHGSTLGPRVGSLVRRDLARLLVVPAWVDPPPFPELDDRAIARLDADRLDAQERAALAYVRAVVMDARPEPETLAAIERELDQAQRVELGFAVAVQLGPALVVRAMEGPQEPGAGPIRLA